MWVHVSWLHVLLGVSEWIALLANPPLLVLDCDATAPELELTSTHSAGIIGGDAGGVGGGGGGGAVQTCRHTSCCS